MSALTILGAPGGSGLPTVTVGEAGTGSYDTPPIPLWIAADGTELFLSSPSLGIVYMPGATGLDLPPMLLTSVQAPSLDGQILRGVVADMRAITIPIYVEALTRADLRARVRTIAAQLDPRSGDGTLRMMEADGSTRQIACRYTGGLTGDESVSVSGMHFRMMVLSFTAYDPFWSDLQSTSQTWPLGGGSFVFPFLLPLVLSPSAVLGNVVITNDGDEPAYPVWVITGPMTAVTLTNSTYSEAFTIARTLTAGETITVNCDPSQLTIVDNASANQWPNVGANPVLWTLRPGDNAVDLALTGGATGSSIAMEYTRRWKTS